MLNTDAVPVDVVTIEGDAPLMFNSVAVPSVTVGALRFRVVPACKVDVPADAEPRVRVVAAAKPATVVGVANNVRLAAFPFTAGEFKFKVVPA